MISPLDLTEEQGHIYKLLYRKADFKTMTVDYTKNQLLVDSSPLFKLTDQKIKTILNFFIKEKMLIVLRKGHKGSATIYEIVTMKQLLSNQLLSNQYVTTNQLLSNHNDVAIPTVAEVEQLQSNCNVTTKQLQSNQPIKDKENEKDKEKIYIVNSIQGIRKLYPGKANKGTADKKLPKLVKEYGAEQLIRAIERYDKYVISEKQRGFTTLNYKDEGTFWNTGYIDYLDENYKESKENVKAKVVNNPWSNIES